MGNENFSNYLENRYNPQIKWYSEKSQWNQKVYKRLQWAIIIFSSLAPIMFLVEEVNKYVPVVISVLVAILTAGLKTFDFQGLWVEYRTTAETLKKEKNFFDFNLYEYGETEDKEGLFVERVEALVSKENTRWIEISKIKFKNEEC